jgi:hypothetical protein
MRRLIESLLKQVTGACANEASKKFKPIAAGGVKLSTRYGGGFKESATRLLT